MLNSHLEAVESFVAVRCGVGRTVGHGVPYHLDQRVPDQVLPGPLAAVCILRGDRCGAGINMPLMANAGMLLKHWAGLTLAQYRSCAMQGICQSGLLEGLSQEATGKTNKYTQLRQLRKKQWCDKASSIEVGVFNFTVSTECRS